MSNQRKLGVMRDTPARIRGLKVWCSCLAEWAG